MKKALRNKTEARPQRSVGKQRRRHIASLQHQEQTTLSYTGHKTVSGITHTIAGSSSDNFSPSSAVSDRKKLSSPANNSIKAINERIARLSMGNQLPSSKLPRRLQSSQSQQTRLLPILPLQSRATKSETTINNNKNNNNVTRNIRPRSKTTTLAAAATENDRQSLRKQNNGNFHSIWRTRKCQRTSEDNDKYHNEKDSCYGHQTTSGNDHLVEAAQSRLKNLLLARERQLDIHEQLKQTFGDIVDQQEESGTELIQQIRLHLDEQALQIQNLERLLAQERSRKGSIEIGGLMGSQSWKERRKAKLLTDKEGAPYYAIIQDIFVVNLNSKNKFYCSNRKNNLTHLNQNIGWGWNGLLTAG